MSTSPGPKVKEFSLTRDIEAFGFVKANAVNGYLTLRHKSGGAIRCEFDSKKLLTFKKRLENAISANEDGVEFDNNFDSRKFVIKFIDLLVQNAEEEYAQQQEEIKQERQNAQRILEEIKELREQHPDITFDHWKTTLQQKHDNLYTVVQKYMPEIWSGLDFELSVLRILNLDNCTLPFIGLLLGRPGSGKTVIISLLRKWYYAYYKDTFTPKAWQSHSTAVKSKEELENIDMLPQIRGKIFLTAELSPMFTKKEDDLAEIIGTIVRIADGQGLSTHSGAHGGRQEGNTMFTWVGAAVDIPDNVYKMLSTLGPKWYHFRLPFRNKTETDLLSEATDDEDFRIKEQEIENALYDYLKWFEIAPIAITAENDEKGTLKARIKWEKSDDAYEAHKYIVKLAILLSHLRCAVQTWESYRNDEETSYEASVCEDPSRTRYVLYNLARGHALQTGRNYITIDDIPVVVKTVLSTAHVDRVATFTLLISMKDGKLSTAQIMEFLNKSKHTALKTMTEFKAIGLVEMDKISIEGKTEDGIKYKTITEQITLKKEFKWFLSEEFDRLREGFVATDNREYMDLDEDKEKVEEGGARVQNCGSTHTIFWSVYDQVEKLELEEPSNHVSVDKNTICHKKLHQALVSSGHFYQGDATQIIQDMVKAGSLEVVSFETYRRGSQQ
jgi:predicted transcriptional regulator